MANHARRYEDGIEEREVADGLDDWADGIKNPKGLCPPNPENKIPDQDKPLVEQVNPFSNKPLC